jgi:S-DNA-T family DNA segregation ATPase FtsK/SpoIIIE
MTSYRLPFQKSRWDGQKLRSGHCCKKKQGTIMERYAFREASSRTHATAQHLSQGQVKTGISLELALKDFGVTARVDGASQGPIITVYELELAAGTKIEKVKGLASDLAMALCVPSVRIAPIPGRPRLGVEIPNAMRETISLASVIKKRTFTDSPAKLGLALGKTTDGKILTADLAEMPHLLVAGTTGSGKSVGMNAMILSLLARLTPADVRFIMIDPKRLELAAYDGIHHLLAPVITDPLEAVQALKWAVKEMNRRYQLLQGHRVRNIVEYNTSMPRGDSGAKMPYIVIVVDELANLMKVAGKVVEATVQELSSMARAAGIHLIMATQTPRADIITGEIKANLPARISYRVITKVDSGVVLGEPGGEQLLGNGDMLYMSPDGLITRAHGPLVTNQEVWKITDWERTQGVPEYVEGIIQAVGQDGGDRQSSDYSIGNRGNYRGDSENIAGGRPKMTLPEWLSMAMTEAPQKVADLLQEGFDIGSWPETTIYDTKLKLGVKHYRKDGAAWWYLPGVTPDSRLPERKNKEKTADSLIGGVGSREPGG